MARSGRPYKCDPRVDNLSFEIRDQNNESVKSLLNELGIDVMDSYQRTALVWASFHNNFELVNWLLRNGAAINHQDKNGFTALHFVGQEKRTDIGKLLIESGPDLEIKDKNGNTALMNAVFSANGNFETVELFLNAGANLDNENNHQMTPRLLAESIYPEEILSSISNWKKSSDALG